MSFYNKQAAWESRTLNDYLSGNDDPTWRDELDAENLPLDPYEVVDDEDPDFWPCTATKVACDFVDGRCPKCHQVLKSFFLKKSGWTNDDFERWLAGKEPF